MTVSADPHAGYFALRADLLGPSRTRTLAGHELMEVGRLVYGDADQLSLYGVPSSRMAERGVRLLGRTAIECSVDAYSAAVAGQVAAHGSGTPEPGPDAFVADLFCGSGNMGFHLGRRLGLPVHASELDPLVHDHTRDSLTALGIEIDLQLLDYRDMLGKLGAASPRDTYVVEPPWGPAFTPHGLDLEATSPPVPQILADITASRDGTPCLVVIKTNDQIARDSLSRSFARARPLATVTPPPFLPHGANMNFHLYRLP
jgi:hypothetical protein